MAASVKSEIVNSNKLLKLFSGSFIIRISYTLLGVVNSILLARILEVESYGVYVFALSIVALLNMPSQFGMPLIVTREFAALHVKSLWSLMKGLELRAHQFVCVVSIFIILLALIFISNNPLQYKELKVDSLYIALSLVPILSLGAIRDAMLRGLRHVLLAQLSESLIRPLLLALGLLYILTFSTYQPSPSELLLYYAVCSLVSFFISWVIYQFKKPKEISNAIRAFETKKWINAAIPIGLTSGIQIINMQISILILGFIGNDSDAAIFRVAALGAGFVLIVLQIVNSVVAPYYARYYSLNQLKKIEELTAKVNKILLLITIPIVVCIILLGEWAINFFYGESYQNAYLPLVILAVGQGVNALMGSVGLLLNMTGHQNDVTKAVFIAMLLNLLLHALLVPSMGGVGAAIAMTVMLITWNLILWYKVKQRLDIKYYF